VAPLVKLAELNPAARIEITALAAWLEAEAALSGETLPTAQPQVLGPIDGGRAASMDDPLVKLAAEVGLNPRPSTRAGVIDCDCPFGHEHTDGNPDGFAFINWGVSHCHHGHCVDAGRRSPDFAERIKEMYREQVAADLAAGRPVEFGTPEAFLAHHDFLRLGALGAGADEVRAQASAQADRMDAQDQQVGQVKGQAKTAALRLLGDDWAFFRSTDGRKFTTNGELVLDLDSMTDRGRLTGVLFSKHGLILTGDAKTQFWDVLNAHAEASPDVRTVHSRAATYDAGGSGETICLDLGDATGQVVTVMAAGWQVGAAAAAPITFVRRMGGLPLPAPVKALAGPAFLDRLAGHINLPSVVNASDPSDLGVQARAGLLMALSAWVRRVGTVPLLYLNGAQGSGKTSLAGRLRDLIDPDEVPLQSAYSGDGNAFATMALDQIVVGADNISGIKGDLSDTLCGIADGAARAVRLLYSNTDRSIQKVKAGVILTSIRDDAVRREDLLDRTIVLSLPPLSGHRRTKAELDQAWEADRPALLAGLLDLLAGGLRLLPTIKACVPTGDLPRLTDAAQFAEAVAQAAGWPARLCLDAINAARAAASSDQLEADPIAVRIRDMLLREPSNIWTGETGDLREKLRFLDGPDLGTAFNTIQGFTIGLNRVAGPMLELWGISRERLPKQHGRRPMVLTMTAGGGSPASGGCGSEPLEERVSIQEAA
jgi:hypothetical protein